MTRKGKEKDATKPDRATWSSEMEKLLIKALLVEIQAGRKAENGHGMTKEGWMNAHAAFNKHSKQPLELMQIKNKANAVSFFPPPSLPSSLPPSLPALDYILLWKEPVN